MQRILVLVLISVFICHCSRDSPQEIATFEGHSKYISVLDVIPRHIQEIENLTVYPGDSQPKYSIELISKQTYGKSGEPYLTNIRHFIVDNQDRVIILDVRSSDYTNLIQIYNDDGSYHSQLGGPGEGPGEYGSVFGMNVRTSNILVSDFSNQRINEYSTLDYSLLRTMHLEQWLSGGESGYVEPRNDGNYLVSFSDSRSMIGRLERKYVIMDSEGEAVDFEPIVFPAGFSIGAGQTMRPSMPLEFMGRTITSLSDEDILHFVFTPDFLIMKYDERGNYQSAIYYPIRGLPFDLDVHVPRTPFEPSVRNVRNAFASLEDNLPETYPVVENLMVDDENRIWVAVPMDARYEKFEWWILNPSGKLLAKLERLRGLIFVVKNGYLYGKEIDERSGAEFVTKYRINLQEIDE